MPREAQALLELGPEEAPVLPDMGLVVPHGPGAAEHVERWEWKAEVVKALALTDQTTSMDQTYLEICNRQCLTNETYFIGML